MQDYWTKKISFLQTFCPLKFEKGSIIGNKFSRLNDYPHQGTPQNGILTSRICYKVSDSQRLNSIMPNLHSLPEGTWPEHTLRNNGPDNLVLERAKLRELAEGWPCYR